MNPALPPTKLKFAEAFEEYRLDHSPENRRALLHALVDHARSGQFSRSDIGPALGVEMALTEGRWVIKCMVWFMRYVTFRNRPMWNDYEMSRWMLTQDASLIPGLAKQIHENGNLVKETGHWMVQSIASQDGVFALQWDAHCRKTNLYAICPFCSLQSANAVEPLNHTDA